MDAPEHVDIIFLYVYTSLISWLTYINYYMYITVIKIPKRLKGGSGNCKIATHFDDKVEGIWRVLAEIKRKLEKKFFNIEHLFILATGIDYKRIGGLVHPFTFPCSVCSKGGADTPLTQSTHSYYLSI